MSDQWEYTVVETVASKWRDTGPPLQAILERLAALGGDGWEAVGGIDMWDKGYGGVLHAGVLMKRRVAR